MAPNRTVSPTAPVHAGQVHAPDEPHGRRRRRFWRAFPLVWLAYVYFPVRAYLQGAHPPEATLLYGLALLAFMAAFAAVYLRADWRYHRALLTAGYAAGTAMYLLGLPVIGYDSATFLVYAGAVAGFQGSLRVAGLALLLTVAALLTPGWLGARHMDRLDLLQMLLLTGVAMYGNHAAYRQAVANQRLARVQAEKERLAADAERERIARDLHDLLGHTLSVIVLKSELAGKLAVRDPVRAAVEIREVERISREALGEVRSAVRGYRGSGLSAELARSKLALGTGGVRLDLDAEPLTLPPEVEYAMEMVLREAVTNVMRHAGAQAVQVRLAREGGLMVLEVRDDGRGRGGTAEGTGLTSMRERVRAAGGQFSVTGGRGTTVRAAFPPRVSPAPVQAHGPVSA